MKISGANIMVSKKDKQSKEEILEQILWNCHVALRGVGIKI